MEDGFEHIQARLPFDIVEIHPDKGSEFFLPGRWKLPARQDAVDKPPGFHSQRQMFYEFSIPDPLPA